MVKNKNIMRLVSLTATALLVYAFVSASPSTHLQNTRDLLASAAVGITVGVPPNPYNSIAQQLEAKQNELSDREQRLAELEKSSKPVSGGAAGTNDFATYSLGMSVLLFMLVAANFYYDWRRARKEQQKIPGQYSINLNKRG